MTALQAAYLFIYKKYVQDKVISVPRISKQGLHYIMKTTNLCVEI